MFYDVGFPNITPKKWQEFRSRFWPRPIELVIDCDEADLPDWFVPLARGIAIADDELLHRAGQLVLVILRRKSVGTIFFWSGSAKRAACGLSSG